MYIYTVWSKFASCWHISMEVLTSNMLRWSFIMFARTTEARHVNFYCTNCTNRYDAKWVNWKNRVSRLLCSTDTAMENAMIYIFLCTVRFKGSYVSVFPWFWGAHFPPQDEEGDWWWPQGKPAVPHQLLVVTIPWFTAYDWRHPRYCPRSPDFWKHHTTSFKSKYL